ncbi:MAG: diguanylate cyclase [Dehalococcoidia bacterium]
MTKVPARILIVEDDDGIADVLDQLLRSEGYSVDWEANGAAAVDRIIELHPDLILLDLMLPGMDGFEICRRLREQDEAPHVPVIIVSALAAAPDRVRGIRSGADDYVTKPFNAEELLSRVALRLARARREREQRDAAVQAGLKAIGYAVAAPETVADLVLRVLDLTQIVLDGAVCGILLWNPVEERFEPTGARGLNPMQRAIFDAIRVPLGISSSVDQLVSLSRPMRLRRESAEGLGRAVLDTFQKDLLVAAPMKYGDRLFGMLVLGRNGVAQDLHEPEVELVSRLADQAAVALAKRSSLDDLERLASTDHLTGLYNRRYMREFLAQQLFQAAASGEVTSVLIIDLDHFKRVNDLYGHLAGDAVLTAVAATMRSALRDSDVAARYGGEEFAVILPGTDLDQARVVAERILHDFRHLTVSAEKHELHVTASIGFANSREGKDLSGYDMVAAATDGSDAAEIDPQPERLIRAADQALYAAKHAGRNCIRQYRSRSTRTNS